MFSKEVPLSIIHKEEYPSSPHASWVGCRSLTPWSYIPSLLWKQIHCPSRIWFYADPLLSFHYTLLSKEMWFSSSRCLSHAYSWGPDSPLKGVLSLRFWFLHKKSPFFSRFKSPPREASWGPVSILKMPIYPQSPNSLRKAPTPSGRWFSPSSCLWFRSLFHLKGTSRSLWGMLILKVLTRFSRRILRSWLPPQDALCP